MHSFRTPAGGNRSDHDPNRRRELLLCRASVSPVQVPSTPVDRDHARRPTPGVDFDGTMSEKNFDRIAAEYDESLPAHVVDTTSKRVAFVTEECPPAGYPRVLDVGCGTGVLAARLAAQDYVVTGLDPSEGMLAVLRADHPGIEAIRGSGDELPFEDGSFDVVVTVAALHHIANPDAVRNARGDGPGHTPRRTDRRLGHNPRNPYWKRLMARVPQDDGSERLIPEAEVLAGLCAGGARTIRSAQFGLVPDFVPPSLLGAVQGVERLAERTPGLRRLCAHNVVLATRE